AGALGLEQARELVGFIVVEASSHQPLQPIAQGATDVCFRNTLNLDALDDVACIDVLDQTAVVADAGDEEYHAYLAIGSRHIAHRGDDVGMFFLDAGGNVVEPRTTERL